MRISDWSSDVFSSDLFVEGNVLALQNLGGHVGREALAEAVGLIARADTVYVAGVRRSFPVAAYLAYSLHQVDKKTVFVDSVGGMARQQDHAIHAEDLLIAVSYHPYAEDTLQRPAERRVGNEGVRTCRSRWSPDH